MAKKKVSSKGVRRGGGRKPGSWSAVQQEQIKAFREKHRVSRQTLARLIGVSSTSVQNWETGAAIATTKLQLKLKAVMDGIENGAIQAGPIRNVGIFDAQSQQGGVAEATGKIVCAYMGSVPNLDASGLVGLIRSVKNALVGV